MRRQTPAHCWAEPISACVYCNTRTWDRLGRTGVLQTTYPDEIPTAASFFVLTVTCIYSTDIDDVVVARSYRYKFRHVAGMTIKTLDAFALASVGGGSVSQIPFDILVREKALELVEQDESLDWGLVTCTILTRAELLGNRLNIARVASFCRAVFELEGGRCIHADVYYYCIDAHVNLHDNWHFVQPVWLTLSMCNTQHTVSCISPTEGKSEKETQKNAETLAYEK